MYYDISVRNSCVLRHHFAEDLFGNVGDVGRGREFNQEQKEKGKEKEPLCVMHKERLCSEDWFQFKEREKCGSGLWFRLECKQAFKGVLFRWMFTFSLWNLLLLAVKTASRKVVCLNGTNMELWLVACLGQVHKSDAKSSFSRGPFHFICLNCMCLHQLVFEYLSFTGPPRNHWGILD